MWLLGFKGLNDVISLFSCPTVSCAIQQVACEQALRGPLAAGGPRPRAPRRACSPAIQQSVFVPSDRFVQRAH